MGFFFLYYGIMWKTKRRNLIFKCNTALFWAGIKVILHKPYYIPTALTIIFLAIEDGIRCRWKEISFEKDVITLRLMKINRFFLPKKYHLAWNYIVNEAEIQNLDTHLKELIKKNTENIQKLWYIECENLGLEMNKVIKRANI